MDNWYLNRLMSMSVAEIYFRIWHQIRIRFQELFLNRNKFTHAEYIATRNILKCQVDDFPAFPHTLNIFGIDFNFDRSYDINWQKDILSGEVFKSHFYSKINIRENPKLSAKSVWELNRLQFLPAICMNYMTGKNKSELDLFVQIIKSWSNQNPFLM